MNQMGGNRVIFSCVGVNKIVILATPPTFFVNLGVNWFVSWLVGRRGSIDSFFYCCSSNLDDICSLLGVPRPL